MTSMIHALDTSSWYELQTDTDSEDENITIREQLDAGNRYIQQVSTGQQQNLERSFAHSIDFLSRPLNTRGSLFLHLLAEMDDANKKVDQYMNAGKITKESLSDTSDGAMSLQEYPIDTSPRFCETDHSGYDEALSSAIAEVSKDFTSGTLSMQPLISEDNDDSHTSSDNDLLHRGAAYARYPETAAGLSDSDWNPYVTESDTNMSPRIASELQPFGISRSTPDSKISPFNPPLCSTKTGISSSKTPRTSSLIDSGKARNASVHLSQIQEQSEMSINSYSTLKTDSSASPAPLSEYSLSKTSSDLKQVPSRNVSQEADRFRLKTHFERTSWPPNTENVSKITTSLVSEEGKSLGRNIKRDLATKSVLGDLQMKSSREFDLRSAEERLKNLSHFEDVPKELSTDENTSLLRKGYFTNAVKSTKVDTKTENQMKAFAELYASVDSLQRASKLKYALPSSEEFSLSNSTGPLASSALVQNGDRNAKGMVKSNEVSNPLHIGSYTTFSTRISGETGLPPSEKSSDELSQQVNRLLMETAYLTGSSRAHGKDQSLQTTNMDYVQLHNDLQEIQNSLQNFGQSAIENPSVAKPNTDNDDIVPSTTTTPERGQGRLVWDHAADFGYGQDYIEQFGDMMSDATTTESSPLESRHANSDNIHYTSDGNETQTSGSSIKGPGDEEEQCDGSMIRRTDVDRELNELISAFRSETKALENRYQAVCSQGLADNVSHPVTRTNHDHQDVIADDQCHMMSNYHIDHKLGSSYTNSFTEKRSHNFSFQEDDAVRKRLELSALSDSSDFTSLQNSKLNAHSDLGKEKVLFSATSTAQRLISKQMKKVADRTFNRSIELHSPMHQIVDCYPVYNTQRDQPQYQRLQQELQQQLQYQSHAQVAQQPTLVASSQQQNQQQLLPPPAPPLPSQAQLGHNVQHQTAPEPEESSADTYIAPKGSLTTEVQQNHLDKKLSDEVKNISPDHEKNVSNNSSPADSDKISDRRKGKYRPYRPIGSQDVYYTESDTASVTDSITTVESTHTGSDDAIGPYFPSSILGSRRDTQSLGSSGIYSKHANATGSSKEFLLPTIQERATPVSGHAVQDGDFKSVPQEVTSLTANCQIKDRRSELAKHMGETDVQSTINTQQQQDNANQLQQNSSLTANDQSYGEYPQHSSQTGLQQFLQKSSREQCLQNEEQFAAQTDQGELEDEKELLKRKAVHVDLQDEAKDPRKEDKFCCKVVLESHLETDRVLANPLSKASEPKGHHESVQAVRNRDNQSEIRGQTHVYTVRDRDNQNETSGQKHVYTVRERDNQNETRGQTHVYTVGDRDSQNETRGQTHVYTVGDRDNQNETRGQTHLNTLRDKDNQNITRRQTHLQAFRDRDDQNETRGQTHVHTLRDRDNQNVTRGQTHVHTLRDRDNQNVTRGQTHLQPFRNNGQTELRREMHETEMTFQSRQREAEEAIERAVGIPVKNNDGTVQQNQNKNYKTADIELIQRGQELLQQQELEEKIDQEPISRRAQLLREALEQEQAYRGQPDLQLLWERFSARFNSSTDKDSTLDSERLNTLGELLRDPTHHLVQSFLQQRQVQQIEDRLRAAAQWDVLRQEKRQQMVERNSSKEDLMVKGQEMHWQESKRQQHQQSSGEDSNGSYGEILLQRERERLKRRDAKTLKKKQNRSPSPHSKTVLQQKGSKVPQSRQSNMTDTLETLYSIPEVINSEASPQKPHLSHKFMISNDLIDPNMNKLREKIMKQREKIGLEHVKEQRRVQKLQKLEALLHAKHYGLLDSEVVAAHLNSISSTSITSNDSTVTNGKLAQNYLSEESTTTKDSSTELHMTKATLAHSPSKTLRSKECFIPLERPQDYLESCNSQTDSDFIPRYHLSSQDLRNEHEGKSRKRLHTVDYLSKHGGKFLKLHRTYSPYPKQDEWLWNKKIKSNKVTSPSLISGNVSNFESARCKLPTTLSVGQRTRHHRLVSKGVQTSPDYGSKIYSHARGQSLSPLYDDHPVIPVPLVSYHNLPITEQCSERGRNIRPSFERGTFSSLNPGRPRSVSPGRCKSWDESFTHSREQSLSPVRGRSPSPVRSQSSSLVRNRSPSPLELRLQAWTERGKSNLARILQKSDTKNYQKINVASNKGHLGGRANKQWNTIPPHTKTFTDQENQPPNKELHGLKECGLSWFIPLLERKPLQVALQESQVSTALQGEWQSAALSPQKRRELIHKEFLEDKNLIMDGQLEGGAARFYLDRSAAEVEKELGKQYDKFQEKPLCKMSLQEALLSKRPSFVSRLRQRQKRLQLAAEHRRLQALARIERDKIFYEPCRIISNPDAHPYSDNLHQPKKRIFTKQEIREQTEKKYRQLPEVKETEILKKRSEEYRLNRLRAKVFNKRLQRKVLEKMRARACM